MKDLHTIEQMKIIADKLSMEFRVVTDLKEFLNNSIKGEKNHCLVVAGSMYLIGEVKSILTELTS